MYKYFFKRFLDFSISFIGLLIISPILIVIIVGLAFANHGKPLFFQTRPGKNGKLFSIIKFKTMNDKKGKNGELLRDIDRITNMGSFIRKFSLDELPQLFNVLKGDMSLIGPRPLLVEYLSLYSNNQKRRHNVRPGITGWAQINGRNAISWKQKFEFDVWYIENYSFFLDVKIFFLTILKVFKSEGVNQSNKKTNTKFNGCN